MEHTTTTRTVTEITIKLDEQDLAQLRESPWDFGEALKARLTPAPNGNGHKPGPHQQLKISKAKKAVRKTSAGKAQGAGSAFAKVPCPECGKEVSRTQLGNHRRKAHGVEPSSTATAAAAA